MSDKEKQELGLIETVRMTGQEDFIAEGKPVGTKLLEYWQWTASHLISNVSRGNFAEYLVALALDIADGVRATWDSFDLQLSDGTRIEVKSSAFIQQWKQKRLYRPTFGISTAKRWVGEEAEYTESLQRNSDIYVFCLHHHKIQETINALDLDQWTFLVLETSVLDLNCPGQKTISLGKLRSLGAEEVHFCDLQSAVARRSLAARST